MRYLLHHWRGEQSLLQSLLVNFLLVSIALSVIHNGLVVVVDDTTAIARIHITLLVLRSSIGIWQLVGLWRCCARHVATEEKVGLARAVQVGIVATMIIAGVGLFVNFDRLLEVIEQAAGRTTSLLDPWIGS